MEKRMRGRIAAFPDIHRHRFARKQARVPTVVSLWVAGKFHSIVLTIKSTLPVTYRMNKVSPFAPHTPTNQAGLHSVQPWDDFAARVGEAVARRSFFVASSTDLRVLWRGERIDSVERRRRITVFAAQNRWNVEIRDDGRAARFGRAEAVPHWPGEILHHEHE
jgi:hypothetical protein